MKSRFSFKSWKQWITKETPWQCSYGELQYTWRTIDINPPPRWCELLGWGTGVICCNWSLEALCSGGVTGVLRCCWALGAPPLAPNPATPTLLFTWLVGNSLSNISDFFVNVWYTDCCWVPSIVSTAQKAALFDYVVCRLVSVWSWIAHRDIHMTCTIAYHVCDIKFLWSYASIGFIFLVSIRLLTYFSQWWPSTVECNNWAMLLHKQNKEN